MLAELNAPCTEIVILFKNNNTHKQSNELTTLYFISCDFIGLLKGDNKLVIVVIQTYLLTPKLVNVTYINGHQQVDGYFQ